MPVKRGGSLTGGVQEPVATGRWTITDLVVIAIAGLLGSVLVVGIGMGEGVVPPLVGQFLLTVGALWVVWKTRRRDFERLRFMVEPRDGLVLPLGAGLQIAVALLFAPLAVLVGLDSEPQALTREIAGAAGTLERLALLLLIGLIGPILEELMFRGVLVDALSAHFKAKGVVIGSSAAFAAFHLTGVSVVQPLQSIAVLLPQLFLFGAVLAYLRISLKRLGPAIFAHAGFNLLSLSILLFYPELL